jgi:hypothetical protein
MVLDAALHRVILEMGSGFKDRPIVKINFSAILLLTGRIPGQTRSEPRRGVAATVGRLASDHFRLDSAGLAEDGGHCCRVCCPFYIQHQLSGQSGQREYDSGVCKYRLCMN